MRVDLEGIPVYFPYEYLYPEQFAYMLSVKRTLDEGRGHAVLEMATGTGKTVCMLSIVLSYQLKCPDMGKLVYCTRTVQEMDKVIEELKVVIAYRDKCLREDGIEPKPFLGLCLSSRRNMCIHARVSQFDNRDKVDALCRTLTASWVRKSGENDDTVELCGFYEQLQIEGGGDGDLTGVLSLDDVKKIGQKKNWCPYFLTRRALNLADVVVYNYQYMLDPKIASLVSREIADNSVVVFDEAHNIDNICIEALSVNITKRTLAAGAANLRKLSSSIRTMETTDAARLRDEYSRLVQGLASSGVLAPNSGADSILASPLIPQDVLAEAVPGNIRKAKHFVMFMSTIVQFLRSRLRGRAVVQESPESFVNALQNHTGMRPAQTDAMKFSSDRLSSLLRTLQITDVDEYTPLQLCGNFATLVASYSNGFAVLMEPYNDRTPEIPDPILRLCCLDASIAMKPVLERFRNVIVTSGTLSPLDVYPKILNFTPKICESFVMSMSSRNCICPIIVSKGSDQVELTSKFEKRRDPGVISNYGKLLVELSKAVPDGLVAFFTSYQYMEDVVSEWNRTGLLQSMLKHKLVFIETQDIVETSLALDSFKRACDCGRGAIFLSVARGKVAEGIDFDRHYGRCVVLLGIPFQYTLSHVLRARLEYLRHTFGIREGDYLSFDAIRQASQCIGRVVRSKTDYGLMVLADQRYRRADKRQKLPRWIQDHLLPENMALSTDRAVTVARDFLRRMGQPHSREDEIGTTLLNEEQVSNLSKELTSGG